MPKSPYNKKKKKKLKSKRILFRFGLGLSPNLTRRSNFEFLRVSRTFLRPINLLASRKGGGGGFGRGTSSGKELKARSRGVWVFFSPTFIFVM
jgi:hypothetical protein